MLNRVSFREDTVKKVKMTIIGKVHDVGYRPFLLNLAEYLFIERFDARNVTYLCFRTFGTFSSYGG